MAQLWKLDHPNFLLLAHNYVLPFCIFLWYKMLCFPHKKGNKRLKLQGFFQKEELPRKSSTTSKLTSKSLESNFYTHTKKTKKTPSFIVIYALIFVGFPPPLSSENLRSKVQIFFKSVSHSIPRGVVLAYLPKRAVTWRRYTSFAHFFFTGVSVSKGLETAVKNTVPRTKNAKLHLNLTLLSLTGA